MHPRQVIIDLKTIDLLDTIHDLPIEIACLEIKDGKITDKTFYHAMTSDQPFKSIAEEFINFISDAEIIMLNTMKNIQVINRELNSAEIKPLKTHVRSITNVTSLARILIPELSDYSLSNLTQHFKLQCDQYADKLSLQHCVLLAKIYAHISFLKQAQIHSQYTPEHRNPLMDRGYSDVTFIDEEKEVQPIKTSVLINHQKLALEKTKRLVKSLNVITTHRPIKSISEKSEADSPIEVTTPNDSKLKRAATYGAFTIFSNHPTVKAISNSVTEIDAENSFYQSNQYKEIKKITRTIKNMQINVTPELLTQAKAQRYQDEAQTVKKELRPRGFLMLAEEKSKPASATNYANAMNLFSDKLRWEWLPLVGFMILGSDSEKTKNVVAGTAHTATLLMLNNTVHELAKLYPDGFTLNVKANLIKNTHLASTIEYTIETKDFTLPLVFNAQTENRPHLCYEQYLSSLTQELVEISKNKPKRSDQMPKSDKAILFFNNAPKQEQAASAVGVFQHLRSRTP
ncbi:MAG: hypothetical protein P4M12_12460 [Gammaproteobacteria bacterium]|nr:hypothetical protein [Gammaproteobacteria bacterium]